VAQFPSADSLREAVSLARAKRRDDRLEPIPFDEPADLAPALDRAFASGTVYCVDVAIDPEAAAASGAAGYAV
jgi:thiamine pyrophosphate-dependent acetolactate synthase large subunit-like protein